jgi:serine/threonine protein kinase
MVDLHSETLKLIDFNTAIKFSEKDSPGNLPTYSNVITGGTGVKTWSAPETRTQLNYSAKCDSFSCGCILFFMLTGREF